MLNIKYFDEMTEERYKADNVNHTLWWAYKYSKKNENEFLNFDDVIWEKDVKEIIEFCQKHGLKKITISSGWSGLNKTVYEFIKMGAKLVGMTEINNGTKYMSDEKDKVPAFVLEF